MKQFSKPPEHPRGMIAAQILQRPFQQLFAFENTEPFQGFGIEPVVPQHKPRLLSQKLLEMQFEKRFEFRGVGRQALQRGQQFVPEPFLDQRNDPVADKIPVGLDPGIACVDPVTYIAHFEIVHDIPLAHEQQRTDDMAVMRANTPEARYGSTAKKIEEHRLGIVADMMPRRHLVESPAMDELVEKRIAFNAGRFLHGALPAPRITPRIETPDMAVEPQPKGFGLHMPLVERAFFSPQLEIAVRNAHAAAENGSEGTEQMQQRHRIGSAGNRRENPFARKQQPSRRKLFEKFPLDPVEIPRHIASTMLFWCQISLMYFIAPDLQAQDFMETMPSPYGHTTLVKIFVLCTLLALGGLASPGAAKILFPALASGCMMFALYFFRDPVRTIPETPSAILAPADGKVLAIQTVTHPFTGPSSTRLSIFMSPLDVHVNRIPFGGLVSHLRYHPGKNLMAFDHASTTDNERMEIGIEADGYRIFFCQVAGFLARRIVCELKPGQSVRAGKRFGMIKFGSRVDILLPENVDIAVSQGERTRAGETVIGHAKQGNSCL